MPVRTCQVCEERPSDLLVSLTETGESRFLCLPCSMPWLQAVWETAGLPRFEIDFPDLEVEEEGTAPIDTGDPGSVRALDGDPPEPEPEDDDTDDATPEEPGVLERIERSEGARAVKPAGYRGRSKSQTAKKQGGRVE